MPRYLFKCDECGAQEYLFCGMEACPKELACSVCSGTMGRIFEPPQLNTQPDKSRDENRWWWLKPGEHYNMESKKELDREDNSRWEADHARFEENRKQYSNRT